jgi:glycosyltransferase involved in cell wall biosynthesis
MRHTPRYCFLAERQVGIGSAAAAIEPHLRNLPGSLWADITYAKKDGFLERLPLPPRVSGVLRGFQQARAALRRAQFDALFFLTHNPAVFQQRAISRVPTVLWTDVTPALLDRHAAEYDHPLDSFALQRTIKHKLVQRTFELAGVCVGWSEWARRSFITDYGVREEKTAVIPPGVDLDFFSPRLAGPRGGLPRLLFVGGNFERKGGDLLLEVYRQHFRGRCAIDLVTRDAIEEEEGVVVHRHLVASSPELALLYERAHAFVLPTRADCFSIASLEAMAKGLPVVITGVGGIPEIVEDGQSGVLLREAEGRALREAIERLLSRPEQASAMGRRGRAIVEARFDARATARQIVSLLGEIAPAFPN